MTLEQRGKGEFDSNDLGYKESMQEMFELESSNDQEILQGLRQEIGLEQTENLIKKPEVVSESGLLEILNQGGVSSLENNIVPKYISKIIQKKNGEIVIFGFWGAYDTTVTEMDPEEFKNMIELFKEMEDNKQAEEYIKDLILIQENKNDYNLETGKVKKGSSSDLARKI